MVQMQYGAEVDLACRSLIYQGSVFLAVYFFSSLVFLSTIYFLSAKLVKSARLRAQDYSTGIDVSPKNKMRLAKILQKHV